MNDLKSHKDSFNACLLELCGWKLYKTLKFDVRNENKPALRLNKNIGYHLINYIMIDIPGYTKKMIWYNVNKNENKKRISLIVQNE